MAHPVDDMLFYRTDLHPDGRKYWKPIKRVQIPNERLKQDLYELETSWRYLGVTSDSYGVIYEYYMVHPNKQRDLFEKTVKGWSTLWGDKFVSLHAVMLFVRF